MARPGSDSSLRRLLLDLGVRGIADVYNALAGLAIFSIVARAISQSDYGVFTQVLTTTALLLPVLLLRLNTAWVRFFPTLAEDMPARARLFCGIALVTLVLSAAAAALLLAAPGLAASWIFGSPESSAIVWLAVYVLMRGQVTLGLDFFRAARQIATATLLNSLRVSLVLAFVGLAAFAGADLDSFLLAHIAGEAIILGVLLATLLARGSLGRPGLSGLRPLLDYSLPLVPYSIMLAINQYADRYFIAHLLGLEEAGRYSFLYSMIAAAFLFGTSISYVVMPHITRSWEAGDRQAVMRTFRATQCIYFGIGIPAAAGLSLLAAPLTGVLAGADFVLDPWSIAGIVLGHLLLGLCTIYGIAIDLSRRTGLYLQVLALAAACNIALNALLIPHYGIAGAALSTALTYLLQLLLLRWRSSGLVDSPIRIEWGFAVRCALAAIAMVLVLQLLPPVENVLWIVIAIAIGALVYALAAWLLLRSEFALIMAALGGAEPDNAGAQGEQEKSE